MVAQTLLGVRDRTQGPGPLSYLHLHTTTDTHGWGYYSSSLPAIAPLDASSCWSCCISDLLVLIRACCSFNCFSSFSLAIRGRGRGRWG